MLRFSSWHFSSCWLGSLNRGFFNRNGFSLCCRRFSCLRNYVLIDLDEFAIACRRAILLTPLNTGISYSSHIQLNCTYRVIITRDNGIHTVWIAVGINDTNYRNLQVISFCNRDTLMIDIDYE